MEEQLDQPVMADRLQRGLFAGRCQAHALVAGMLDQTRIGQTAHHVGRRGRGDTQSSGEG